VISLQRRHVHKARIDAGEPWLVNYDSDAGFRRNIYMTVDLHASGLRKIIGVTKTEDMSVVNGSEPVMRLGLELESYGAHPRRETLDEFITATDAGHPSDLLRLL
jgi:hypothetical protein